MSTQENPKSKPLLSSKARAAESLGISLRSLDYLIASGDLVTVRIGRRRMVVTKSLENFCRRDHPTRRATEDASA